MLPHASRPRGVVRAQDIDALGEIVGNVAHDFNNLFGIIIGNLDLLREAQAGRTELDELLRDALAAALRGAGITRSLLAVARRQPLQPRPVDVNELVAQASATLQRSVGKHIEIALNLAPDLWPVLADPAPLAAALADIAANARDAMPKGGRLTVATGNRRVRDDAELAAGDYVVIELSDTGTGIPAELVGRLFEPFFTTKDRGSAAGLGLSAAFGYAKQSGGHIGVESALGKGTSFRLYLPRAAASVERAHGAPPSLDTGGLILVVEDDPAMRRIAVRHARALGYEVREAEHAAAAMALLESERRIDLLFTDIAMPGKMDGLALARAVAQRWPHIKIVITSDFARTRIDGNSAIPPGTIVLSKPYRREDLAHALRDPLADRRRGVAQYPEDPQEKGASRGGDSGH